MKQPFLNGRRLPRNDWEGDDFTPGAGGRFVTCQDTAAGRMLAFATNGRVDLDGRRIRAAMKPADPDGVSLRQVGQAIHDLTGRRLVIPDFDYAKALAWLRAGHGLIVDGYYGAIPRSHRYQANADFNHAIWISHYSRTSGWRVWDPLNPDTTGYGRWFLTGQIKPFIESLGVLVGYIMLEPL